MLIRQTPFRVVCSFPASSGLPTLVVSQIREEAELAPLFSQSWADVVWSDAVAMACEFILADPSLVQERAVIELGACHGLPGMLSSLLGAKRVMVTDKSTEAAQRTVKENENALQGTCQVEVKELDWARPDQSECLGSFEVILAVECVSVDVYGREALNWLVQQIQRVSAPGSLCVVCSRRRSGDGLEDLVQELQANQGWRLRPRKLAKDGVELFVFQRFK